MSDEQRKYPPLTQHYVDVAEYIADLEERAGVPRPCPKCGWLVTCQRGDCGGWCVTCGLIGRACDYLTQEVPYWQEAWREHEMNCRKAEEDEK